MFKNLKDIKIFGEFQGERVQITKIDLINKSCSILKNVYGKKVPIAYSSKDKFGSLLTIENFTNIEIIEK